MNDPIQVGHHYKYITPHGTKYIFKLVRRVEPRYGNKVILELVCIEGGDWLGPGWPFGIKVGDTIERHTPSFAFGLGRDWNYTIGWKWLSPLEELALQA